MQGIRGAISAGANTREAIQEAVSTLLAEMLTRNSLTPAALTSAVFSVTEDLDPDLTAHAAHAARGTGWREVAIHEAREVVVPGSVPRCIRVFLHVDRPALASATPAPFHDVFLGEAAALAPDLADPFPMSVETAKQELRRISSSTALRAVRKPEPSE